NYNVSKGIFGSPWAGFDNFKFFFMSGSAWTLTKNTMLYNLAFLVVNVTLEVMLAIFISEMAKNKVIKVCQSIMLLPHFISWVVVAVFLFGILNFENGSLNRMLISVGAQPVHVYSDTVAWKYILVALNSWKAVGYGSIVYLSAIMGVDISCYESAEIDGANQWQRIVHITLPMIKPTIITMVLLSIGSLLRGNFEMFYQIIGNNAMLYNSTDIIDTFVFRSLLTNSNMGMNSAAALYQSVLCFITITTVNAIVRKVDRDNALF
nr:ABC transporter permease subunit [Bacillota bacterium]